MVKVEQAGATINVCSLPHELSILDEVLAKKGPKIRLYENISRVIGRPEFNQCQLDAFHYIFPILSNRLSLNELGFGVVEGPMRAGKSRMVQLISEGFNGDVQVFKHKQDDNRVTGGIKAHSQKGGRMVDTKVDAELYESLADLKKRINLNGSNVILIDEFQLVKQYAPSEFDDFRSFIKENKLVIVFLGLDLDYTNNLWLSMIPVWQQADLFRVRLASRCEENDCGGIAYQTKKLVWKDGKWEAASADGRQIEIESMGEKTSVVYKPSCSKHHLYTSRVDIGAKDFINNGFQPEYGIVFSRNTDKDQFDLKRVLFLYRENGNIS